MHSFMPAHAEMSAEELAKRLTTWLDEYRGATPVGDDRTFLIARRVGSGAAGV